MDRNCLENLEPYAFQYLKNLRKLSLSQNNILRIKAFNFHNASLDKLMMLNLSNNRIGNVESCSFIKLINLKRLDLSSNQISDLDEYTLQGLDKLIALDLSYNKLVKVDNHLVFGHMTQLVSFAINKNPLKTKINNRDVIAVSNSDLEFEELYEHAENEDRDDAKKVEKTDNENCNLV